MRPLGQWRPARSVLAVAEEFEPGPCNLGDGRHYLRTPGRFIATSDTCSGCAQDPGHLGPVTHGGLDQRRANTALSTSLGDDHHRDVTVEDAIRDRAQESDDLAVLDSDKTDLRSIQQLPERGRIGHALAPVVRLKQHARSFDFGGEDGADFQCAPWQRLPSLVLLTAEEFDPDLFNIHLFSQSRTNRLVVASVSRDRRRLPRSLTSYLSTIGR